MSNCTCNTDNQITCIVHPDATSNSELKACPFCGWLAEERDVPGSFGGYQLREIACTGCGARVKSKETWNTRA
jgi:hypothetical protein